MEAVSNASEPTPKVRGLVLVVEDQPELLAAMGDLLREEGFRVELAGDGAQALVQAGREEPDVVLMDLRLPGTDGLEVTQQIKALVPEALFIVHSWYSDPATVASLQSEGIFGFIAKGSPSYVIVEAVEHAVAKKRWLEAGMP